MSEITRFSGTVLSAHDIDGTVHLLMQRVGARVRKARELKGIARRVLSEKSGVSPRYLAQLESGEGNISIGLLTRVAIALDMPMEWLISEEDPWVSETQQMLAMFRAADQSVRARVLEILAADTITDRRAQRVCLVGLRGAGKSTLGRAASKALGVPFLELNVEIEAQAGMPVGEIIALYGQEGYRKLEADALDRIVASHDRLILAVAGGIVAEPATYAGLLARFHTIWVKASPQEHMDRVRAQGDERPMAGNPEAMAQLRSILTSREALYDQAQTRLDTTGMPIKASLAQLLDLMKSHNFLE